jgi:hypothetical protein
MPGPHLKTVNFLANDVEQLDRAVRATLDLVPEKRAGALLDRTEQLTLVASGIILAKFQILVLSRGGRPGV